MKAPFTVSVPGRANLIGNPSDIYGGSQISCSVDRRARAAFAPDTTTTLVTGGEVCPLPDAGALTAQDDLFEIARAVLRHTGLPSAPCRIEYDSTIPLRSGLAGSTALLIALLRGVRAWRDEPIGPYALAEKARHVERTEMDIVGGYGDQYVCTFGGLCYLDFRGKLFDCEEEAQLFATVEKLGAAAPAIPFVLGFTGVRHHSGLVHAPIRERWLAGEPAVVTAYERVAETARLGKRALLRGDWTSLGALMNENHAIQRELGGSGEANERLIAAALAAGAPGAKLAGAGHGGTIVALWPDADRAPLEAALRAAGAEQILVPSEVPGVRLEPDA